MSYFENIIHPLTTKDLLSISDIKCWYEQKEINSLYNYRNYRHTMFFHCEDSSTFCSIYQSVEQILKYHSYESIAIEELSNLKEIEGDKSLIKNWLIKNKELAGDELCLFPEYHVVPLNGEEHILVHNDKKRNIRIFADYKDFSNLLEYIDKYDHYYYHEELYPESLNKLKEEMEKSYAPIKDN